VLESPEQRLGRVVRRALVTPVSLSLLTASSLCLAEPATWPLTALGLVAEAIVLQLLVRDPNFVRALRNDEQQAAWRLRAERLTRARRTVDHETSAMLGRIQSLHERLVEAHRGDDALLGGGLDPRLGQVGDLLDRCVHLAEKRHQLRLYLDDVRPTDLQRQASQLEAKQESAIDPVARELYQQAVEQKRGELESYCAILQAVQRIDGQLESIECSFGNLLGRLIRLKSTNDAHAALAQRQVTRELTELNANLDALESSVNEVLAIESRA